MKSRTLLVGLVVLALGVSANAQIRSPQDHLGFRVGDDYKLASWEQITTYFEELGRSSDRIRTENVGETTLGRPFLVVTISSPENQANLDRYREITRRLIDPRGLSEEEAEQLIGEGKSVIAITCSIHSTEVAASQMSMELAYNLATGTSDTVQDILDKVIFVLVPSLNPDGIDIVGDWYRTNLDTEYENAPASVSLLPSDRASTVSGRVADTTRRCSAGDFPHSGKVASGNSATSSITN